MCAELYVSRHTFEEVVRGEGGEGGMGIWMEEINLDGGLHGEVSISIGLTAADGSLDRTKEQLDRSRYIPRW